MWWLIGSAQTSKAVVPGLNPASLTKESSEDMQSHYVTVVCILYVKSRGREGDLPLKPKKIFCTGNES